MIIAIDPGPTQSAVVRYDYNGVVVEHCISQNSTIRSVLELNEHTHSTSDVLVIEQIAGMGMAVGAEVFETCFESGRFAQAWGREFHRIKRLEVKLHLCGQARAKDANVRQALIDRFGGPQATKKGGALYKVKGDEWAALAVAVTWADVYGQAHEVPQADDAVGRR